jgi:hypothetical protein
MHRNRVVQMIPYYGYDLFFRAIEIDAQIRQHFKVISASSNSCGAAAISRALERPLSSVPGLTSAIIPKPSAWAALIHFPSTIQGPSVCRVISSSFQNKTGLHMQPWCFA